MRPIVETLGRWDHSARDTFFGGKATFKCNRASSAAGAPQDECGAINPLYFQAV